VKRRGFVKLGFGAFAVGVLANPGLAAPADAEWSVKEFHARRRFLQMRGGHIAYVERGAGSPALFLHGWPLNSYHWRGSMGRLSLLRRCIAVDFMGLGYTEVPAEEDLSPSSQANMIVAVMNALRADRADLISNDSGTAVAQLIASRYPDRVRSILITNGDVHTNSPPDALKPTIEEARQGLLVERLARQVRDPRMAQTQEGLGVAYTNPLFVTPDLVDVYLRPLVSSATRRLQCQSYGVAFEPSPLPGIEAQLKRSRIPVRMLWGTGDPLFPPEWAEWLNKTLPNSKGIRYVEGAKLFFTEEFPGLVAEEARRLWAYPLNA
jgi:pimeloyl-ACP methyl ester carboxylesterase